MLCSWLYMTYFSHLRESMFFFIIIRRRSLVAVYFYCFEKLLMSVKGASLGLWLGDFFKRQTRACFWYSLLWSDTGICRWLFNFMLDRHVSKFSCEVFWARRSIFMLRNLFCNSETLFCNSSTLFSETFARCFHSITYHVCILISSATYFFWY